MPSEYVFEAFLIHYYRLSLEEARDELKCRLNVFLKLSLFITTDCLEKEPEMNSDAIPMCF